MKSTFKLLAFIAILCAPAVVSQPTFAEEKPRIEVSLLGLFPLGEPYEQKYDDYYLVRGRIFDNAIVQSVFENMGTSTYETKGEYDVFEADIATETGSIHDQLRFFVLGDGNVIYRSRRLTNQDKPIHISVPIKKYRGITLVTEAYFRGGLPRGVWGDPKLVRTSAGLPRPISLPQPAPKVNARPPAGDSVTLSRESEGPYQVAVNGKPVRFGTVQPVVKDGALLVPMRPLFEALGATVTFDENTRVILATRGGREIRMQLDSTSAYIDGRSTPLDVPAQSQMGTTLVPLRFISESFGAKISFPEPESDTANSGSTTGLPY